MSRDDKHPKAYASDKKAYDFVLEGSSAGYLEALYETYLKKPHTLAPAWRTYFESLGEGQADIGSLTGSKSGPGDLSQSTPLLNTKPSTKPSPTPGVTEQPAEVVTSTVEKQDLSARQIRVLQLINSYRYLGHKRALTNPLDEAGIAVPDLPEVPELTLAYHHLSDADLPLTFHTGSLYAPDEQTLEQIIQQLEHSYCDVIGSQYMHISSTEEKRWLQKRLESRPAQKPYSAQERKRILEKLIAAETLERYLHTKYVGQKRFSLEGGDSLIPMLDTLIQHCGVSGAREIVLGMAHRGRLNVLINIMGKAPAALFKEFDGDIDSGGRTGDVKYHLGFSSDMQTPGGPVHLALAFNPSHLEIVGPVVEGAVRARQDRRRDAQVKPHNQIIPVVIHGDAALAGQGVNMETLNMSETRGFRTHGTVHIVINNQIGFTTSTRLDARSTEYCTDLAKMVGAPVFHVNGDRPEAVIDITRIAVDYRNTFNKDVFIDLVCYRRHGHNEADEPAATQPIMYKKIRALETTMTRYSRSLEKQGVIDDSWLKSHIAAYKQSLDKGAPTVPNLLKKSPTFQDFPVEWNRFKNTSWKSPANTLISVKRFHFLGERLTRVPDGFNLNPRVKSINDKRRQMVNGEIPADWGFAENLAYAALLQEGFPVRLSGEDSARGTFFHRHAHYLDQETGKRYIPLRNITEDQESFDVINSLLSEEAVLAFEYGYATTEAHKLVIWEAQFGDFANGAQIIIDQFISSAEQKWGLLSGLVLFLPHGYEGMGPEHSSARLERYLQLCAQENMQVCMPTTPAQMFHLLRRQMIRRYRKPLIVMTPKSLLRHPLAVSPLELFTELGFQTVIDEIDKVESVESVHRIVLCSGKVYYDLLEKRRSDGLQGVVIVRLEQLYPLPYEHLGEVIKHYPNARELVWAQEEPFNQGAWLHLKPWLEQALDICGFTGTLSLASRPAMAAPAEGSHKAHRVQQEKVVQAALGLG